MSYRFHGFVILVRPQIAEDIDGGVDMGYEVLSTPAEGKPSFAACFKRGFAGGTIKIYDFNYDQRRLENLDGLVFLHAPRDEGIITYMMDSEARAPIAIAGWLRGEIVGLHDHDQCSRICTWFTYRQLFWHETYHDQKATPFDRATQGEDARPREHGQETHDSKKTLN